MHMHLSRPALRLTRLWQRVAAMALVASLVSTTLVAAQQATAGGAIVSLSGETIVTHPNGESELAKVGTPVSQGDRVAVPGAGGAVIGYSDGSRVGLQPRTTVAFKQLSTGGNGTALVTGDVARGTVTAEAPAGREAEIRVTSEASGAVALLKQGDMAVRVDEDTSNVSVACDQASDRVYFPYADLRVPCEQRIVRTFTSDGDIVDTAAGRGSLLSAVVDNNGDRRGNGINAGGQTEQRNQGDDGSDDDDQPPVQAPPQPVGQTGPVAPCNAATRSGGAGVTTTSHELGRASGTFPFAYDAQTLPDRFDIIYEGRTIFTTGGFVSGSSSVNLPYGGSSSIITVIVTGRDPGTAWTYLVGCPS